MEEKIMSLVENVTKLPKEELDLNADIFESNMISSLGLLELVAQLEKKFNIVVLPEELIHENFGTIQLMIEFVQKKMA